jgi:integrase
MATPGSTFGTIVKLLLLTGQRRGEISALRSKYINRADRIITLPAELTKNKSQHSFPYGDLVAQLLPDRDGYLFPAAVPFVHERPTKVFNGWPKAKRTLDEASGVADWVLHDLRRTFATNLAELGVEPHIIEALINHKSGVISGVAATYNRARYMQPMRDAIAKWEGYLQQVLPH